MGKIYKVKDKEGKIKYPVTVSDAVVVGDKTLTKKLEEYHSLKPLIAKTYVDLYYGANKTSSGYFEPICVKPKDPTKTIGEYYIKFKMSTTCSAYPNYKNFSIVELWFNRTGSINCSRIWNWRVGSYLHYYVGVSYPSSNDDFNTIGTHFGVAIVSGNNYNSANYKRETLIEIFEVSDDLVVTMDEPEDNKQYSLMPWYDANKITHTTFNAVDVGLQETGDSNTYDRTYLNGARFYIASDVRFHGYSLAFFDKEGKINPLSYCGTSYTATAYTKASGTRKYTTKGLVWKKGIMYYGTSSNNASGALLSTSSLYYTIPGVDLRYSDNCVASNVATNTLGTEEAKDIYLRGVIKEDGLFYFRLMEVTYNNNVYEKAWTQNPEDGFDEEGYRYVYWHLAYYYYNSSYPIRGYQYTLPINNPMYIVEDGELMDYDSYIHTQKQDIIDDLEEIREGANKGATSVQETDISDMETKTHAIATYVPNTNAGADALLSTLPNWTATPTDNVKFIRRDTGGTNTFGQVTFLTLWNYIKDKISSVLGLTTTNYGGNSATATKATQDGDGNVISSTYQKIVSGKGLSTNDFTTALKNKLDGIAVGAEVNVQSDWNETNTTSDAFIKNKPAIPSAITETTVSGWGFTKNTGTYSKPSGGIPKTDLASAVQTSLGKADSALQEGDDVSKLVNDKGYIKARTYSSSPLPSVQEAIMARVDALVRELLNGIGEDEGGSLVKYVIADATKHTDEDGVYYTIPISHKDALVNNQPDVVILDNNLLYKTYSEATSTKVEVHYASVSNQMIMSFRVSNNSNTNIIMRVVDTMEHLTEYQLKSINGESIVGVGDLKIDISNAIKVVDLEQCREDGRFVCDGYFYVSFGGNITRDSGVDGLLRMDYVIGMGDIKFYFIIIGNEATPSEWEWVGLVSNDGHLYDRDLEEVASLMNGTYDYWKTYLDIFFPSTTIDAYTKSEIDNKIGDIETILASL